MGGRTRSVLALGLVLGAGVVLAAAVGPLGRHEGRAMRDIRDIVAEVDGMAPADPDALDLDRLGVLAGEYFAHPAAAGHLGVWFRLFERYPEFDGYESFWSILHAIEDQPGYEPVAAVSARRRPSHLPVTMVQRMLNANIRWVGGTDLRDLLRRVAADGRSPASVREQARYDLEHFTDGP